MNKGSIHRLFTHHLYWPFAQKLKGLSTGKVLELLNYSQWRKFDRLIDEQWREVQQTVHWAARKVPVYRKYYKNIAWVYSCEHFTYEDFSRLPTIDKETLRDNLNQFIHPTHAGRITTGRTSGSTGISQLLYYDNNHQSYSEAARWRGKSWWGIVPGDPQVVIWGRPFTGIKDRIGQTLKSYLMNTLFISAFDLTSERLRHVWESVCKFRPKIIYGYPSAIYLLASYLEEQGISAPEMSLKVVMTTAESITTDQRLRIENVFGVPTANEYGCSETGGFAYECPQHNWHISCESVFVEFLDHSGIPVAPGCPGQIVVTDLRNKYMPLIRYRVGDIGTAIEGICPCGRNLPVMKVSSAKVSDTVTLQNGATFSSEIFDYINLAVMKAYPKSILQFRIRQKTAEYFEAEIVPGKTNTAKAERLFLKNLKRQLGQDVTIQFIHVREIKREPNGKLRYFISELN